jgi:hypothetical protein
MVSLDATSFKPPAVPIPGAEDAFGLTRRRLRELDRLRGMAMAQAERVTETALRRDGSPDEQYQRQVGGKGSIQEFDRLQRAIRQIVVLEFELRGLFKAPDREGPKRLKLCGTRLGDLDLDGLLDFGDVRRDFNDLNDLRVRMDYSRDPLHEVVAGIRSALRAFPPLDDPFAPPPAVHRDEPPEDALLRLTHELNRRLGRQPSQPSMMARTAEAQKEAAPTIRAKPVLPRNGFRVAPTSKHNPKTARASHKGRGPP